MPAKIDKETRGQIVRLRALDYDKQDIAEELGISRNTVSRHLEEIQEEAQKAEDPDAVILDALLAGMIAGGVGYAVAKILKGLQEEDVNAEHIDEGELLAADQTEYR